MKKNKSSFLVLVSIAVIFAFSFRQNSYLPRTNRTFIPENVDGAIDYFLKITANQITGQIDVKDVEAARNAIRQMASNRLQSAININWQEMGPDNVGGRTRALMLDKDSVNVIYAGGVAGGLWKSTNGGASWKNLFDKFENNAVSCITQAANGDIYVGTGEGHYNVGSRNGTGVGGMIGSGIYKSTDRGAHWARLSSKTGWCCGALR